MSMHSSRWVSTLHVKSAHVCAPCLRKLAQRQIAVAQRTFASRAVHEIDRRALPTALHPQYFLSNETWQKRAAPPQDSTSRRAIGTTAAIAQSIESQNTTASVFDSDPTIAPRRRRRKQDEADSSMSAEPPIPLDASTQLSNLSSRMPQNSLKQRFFTYLSLSKPRLTFLIVLTTTSAYTLFPVAVSPMSSSLALSPLTLLNLTAGTALSSACANALNMLFEPAHDAKMSRTRSRPLVRGLLTSRAALGFAALTGTAGIGLLHFGVEPTVAALSALNIFLYAGVYTPLKRIHFSNTWVGAIVGGIPPLMGWTAAASQSNTIQDGGWKELLFDPTIATGGWLLAAFLFAWQFPHFNALSWTIRHEYANAGYKMLASINPHKNGVIALRYSLWMFPITAGLCYANVTSWAFLPLATAFNVWMTKEAWRFYKYEGAKGSARGLFWASVWHLPLVLVLAMATKKGLWDRVFKGGLDDDEWEEFSGLPTETSSQHQKSGIEGKAKESITA